MNPKVKNVEKILLSDNWYTLNKVVFDYQNKDGSWAGDYVGETYGTAAALSKAKDSAPDKLKMVVYDACLKCADQMVAELVATCPSYVSNQRVGLATSKCKATATSLSLWRAARRNTRR